jgi:hypothetical protein
MDLVAGLDSQMSEQSGGSEPGAEAIIIHSDEQHQPSLGAKQAGAAAAELLGATQSPATAEAASHVQRAASVHSVTGTGVPASLQQAPLSGEMDVFYDASELGRADVLELLMKELQRDLKAAKEQRQEANRFALGILQESYSAVQRGTGLLQH